MKQPFERDLKKLLANIGNGKVGILSYHDKIIKLVCFKTGNDIMVDVFILQDGEKVEVQMMLMTFDALAELIGGKRQDGEKHIRLVK